MEPAKITSAGLLVSGISARSRQTVEASSSKDFYRPIAPQPAPAQAQAAQAITAPEKKTERRGYSVSSRGKSAFTASASLRRIEGGKVAERSTTDEPSTISHRIR